MRQDARQAPCLAMAGDSVHGRQPSVVHVGKAKARGVVNCGKLTQMGVAHAPYTAASSATESPSGRVALRKLWLTLPRFHGMQSKRAGPDCCLLLHGCLVSFASPQSISSDLIARLDDVASGRVDRSLLKQIAFQAMHLRKNKSNDFLMVSGIIAALEGDAATARRCFEEAIQSFGYESVLVRNYYQILFELGETQEAIALLKRAIPYVHEPEFLRHTFMHLLGFGYYLSAGDVAQRLFKMTGEDWSDDLKGLDEALPALGISEQDMFDAVSVIRKTLKESGHMRAGNSVRASNDRESGPMLAYRVFVPGTADVLFALETRIHEALAAANLKAAEQGAVVFYLHPEKGLPSARDVA